MEAVFHNMLKIYGKIMIGDRGFEFYDDRDVNRHIQICWEEIAYVSALVFRKGKWILRFTIHTKNNGEYAFSARNTKSVLQKMSRYLSKEKIVHQKTLFNF